MVGDGDRDTQMADIARVLQGFAEGSEEIAVASSHLEEDVAAEEIGFSVIELASHFTDSVVEEEPAGAGTVAFFESLEASTIGQAMLLQGGQDIEIMGEDILPEDDAQMAAVLRDLARLKSAAVDLCGDSSLLLAPAVAEGKAALSMAFSPEGDVISYAEGSEASMIARRWRRMCIEG